MSYTHDDDPAPFEGFRFFDALGNKVSEERFRAEDGVDHYLDPHDPKMPVFPDNVWKITVSGKAFRWSTPLFPVGSYRTRVYLRSR